jgi:hypothetical protein
MTSFPRHIAEYVALQRALLSAISELIDVSQEEFFNDIGVREMIHDGKRWRCAGHGRGLTFQEVDTGVTVNVHTVPFLEDALDEWRLELYFESRGVTEASYGGHVYELSSERIGQLLDELAHDGLLVQQIVAERDPPIVVYRPTTKLLERRREV